MPHGQATHTHTHTHTHTRGEREREKQKEKQRGEKKVHKNKCWPFFDKASNNHTAPVKLIRKKGKNYQHEEWLKDDAMVSMVIERIIKDNTNNFVPIN